MANDLEHTDLSVDRREETVVTEEPGYAATEQVTRDVAAERRMRMFNITRFFTTILGILEILLGLRFVLRLIAANPNSGFAEFIYAASGIFVAPFTSLVATPTARGAALEVTTLIAMAVYALLFWIVLSIIPILVDRPSARSVSRSVHERTPAGGTTDRTTRHTTVG